jgi:hypothetical protein
VQQYFDARLQLLRLHLISEWSHLPLAMTQKVPGIQAALTGLVIAGGEMDAASSCGSDCALAIDAAVTLMQNSYRASRELPAVLAIAKEVVRVCEIYING